MSIRNRTRNTLNVAWSALLACAWLILSPAAQAAEAGDEKRVTVNRHHVTGGRENLKVSSESVDEQDALAKTGDRSKSKTRGSNAKPGTSGSQSPGNDFWFYDADVILFNDADNDGYYYGIDLLFDADTIYAAADVYAVLYLSFEGGPWNEYAATEDFTLFGASSDDEYVLVSELMSGYPTGSYDLLIELFDAYDGTLLASFGPVDTSELGFLPLEDANRDTPVRDVIVVTQGGGGGGAADGWTLLALLLLLFAGAARKIWRHRNDALERIDTPAPVWTQAERSRNRY